MEPQELELKKQEFITIYKENIHRPGADKLLEYMLSEESDFFTAPASTRYHGAYAGGLLVHSLNVYNCLKAYLARDRVREVYHMDYSEESIAICALLHDLCKMNFYTVEFRNSKNAAGQWEKVPYYKIDDRLPYGHGEKSVFLIERKMRLKLDEAMAIRWHMGEFGDKNSNAISQAYDAYPLAVKLHLADLESTYLREKGTSAVRR